MLDTQGWAEELLKKRQSFRIKVFGFTTTRITGFSASNVVKRKDFFKPGLEEKNKGMAKQELYPYFKGFPELCRNCCFHVF
jgi:hypothetical protein